VEGGGGGLSAGEIAAAVKQPLAQVTYHLKTLARCEVLRLNEDGDRDAREGPRYGWSLGVEADWLRVVLDVWLQSRSAG
jgi:DNA-binding transcriptional ArsR family regulator